ncbi:hypothetical protein A2U01_0079844 [Trifolium medium]|uniref:Uncharacterized protein n=1 Tax=Trifolium medium TaxID=97028 RepID=A0A392TBW1_9FABA|nr:hypothetical protein [Trifolium medium]
MLRQKICFDGKAPARYFQRMIGADGVGAAMQGSAAVV